MPNPRAFRWITALALSSVGACSADAPLALTDQPTASLSQTSSTPAFLSLDPGATPLADTTVSFYAVKGQDREVFMWYANADGSDSSKFVRFKVQKESLCKRPNGTNIAKGDSILITLTVTDFDKQIVEFQPSGLTFCSGRPAKLNVWYLEADHDFDHDGDIDAADAAFERGLRIWKREGPTAPWLVIPSMLDEDLDEVEADITGFTSYVVAY